MGGAGSRMARRTAAQRGRRSELTLRGEESTCSTCRFGRVMREEDELKVDIRTQRVQAICAL